MTLSDIVEYGLLVLSFLAGSLAINRIIQIACSHYFYGTSPQQEIAYTLQWWGLSITKHGGIWFWRIGIIGGSFYLSRKNEL